MTDELIEAVVWRDLSSGRMHQASRLPNGQIQTSEACNLDDAGAHEILEELPEGFTDEDLCERCYGHPDSRPTLNTRGDAP